MRVKFNGFSGVTIRAVLSDGTERLVQAIEFSQERKPAPIYTMDMDIDVEELRIGPRIAGTIMFVVDEPPEDTFDIYMLASNLEGRQSTMWIKNVKIVEQDEKNKHFYLFIGESITPWKEIQND